MDSSFDRYDVYTTAGSIYCYKDTNVLYNRFNIRDNSELKKLEADITTIRQQDMLARPVKGHFTINHLCVIHKYLFGDIYPFAGHIRREIISKGHCL